MADEDDWEDVNDASHHRSDNTEGLEEDDQINQGTSIHAANDSNNTAENAGLIESDPQQLIQGLLRTESSENEDAQLLGERVGDGTEFTSTLHQSSSSLSANQQIQVGSQTQVETPQTKQRKVTRRSRSEINADVELRLATFVTSLASLRYLSVSLCGNSALQNAAVTRLEVEGMQVNETEARSANNGTVIPTLSLVKRLLEQVESRLRPLEVVAGLSARPSAVAGWAALIAVNSRDAAALAATVTDRPTTLAYEEAKRRATMSMVATSHEKTNSRASTAGSSPPALLTPEALLTILQQRQAKRVYTPLQFTLLVCALLRGLGFSIRLVHAPDVADFAMASELRTFAATVTAKERKRRKRQKRRHNDVSTPSTVSAFHTATSMLSNNISDVNSEKNRKRRATASVIAPGNDANIANEDHTLPISRSQSVSSAASRTKRRRGDTSNSSADANQAVPNDDENDVRLNAGQQLTIAQRRGAVSTQYWLEVYCTAPAPSKLASDPNGPYMDRWVAIDPFRTFVDEPQLFDRVRPRSDPLLYAIACAEDGSMRDVSRRYVSAWAQASVVRAAHGIDAAATAVRVDAFSATRSAIALARKGGGDNANNHVRNGARRTYDYSKESYQSSDPPPLPHETWLQHTLRILSRHTMFTTPTTPASHKGTSSSIGIGSAKVFDVEEDNDDVIEVTDGEERSIIEKSLLQENTLPSQIFAQEDAEFKTATSSRDPMPTNAAAFKTHPQYVLEKDLLANEVLDASSNTNLSSSSSAIAERALPPVVGYFKGIPVYSRSAVVKCLTAEAWLRQPLPRVVKAECVESPARTLPRRAPRQWATTTPATDSASGRRRVHIAAARARNAAAKRKAYDGGGEVNSDSDAEGGQKENPQSSDSQVLYPGGLGASAAAATDAAVREVGGKTIDNADEEKDDLKRRRLYAPWQTEVYVPLPYTGGPVPSNGDPRYGRYYELWGGNTALLPAGLSWCVEHNAKTAARQLNIDFVDAFIGFEYIAGGAKPQYKGIIIPSHHVDAVVEAAEMLQQQAIEKSIQKVNTRALSNWKRLLNALAIRRRLQRDYGSTGDGTGVMG